MMDDDLITCECDLIFLTFLILGKEFQGRRLKVSMARRKPMMGGMRGGMPMRDGMMGRGGKCHLYLLVLDYLGACSLN